MKSNNTQIVAAEMKPLISNNPQSSAPTEVVQNPKYDEPWVAKDQIMAHFGMGERTIERYIRQYNMPCQNLGWRLTRFKISEVQAFLEQRGARRFAAIGRANTIRKIKHTVAQIASLHGLRMVKVEITSFPLPART
jgi:predicted DNA-binding transcriptional regulator AlpA